jgi:hypothetical protein
VERTPSAPISRAAAGEREPLPSSSWTSSARSTTATTLVRQCSATLLVAKDAADGVVGAPAGHLADLGAGVGQLRQRLEGVADTLDFCQQAEAVEDAECVRECRDCCN